MEDKILFSEQQKFKQWWLWIILPVLNFIFILGIYKQIILKEQFGDNPMSNSGLVIGLVLMISLTILFGNFKLQTIIKNDGIYVRFFPFQIAYRKYTWDKLINIYVREYNPITEYRGWGLKYGIFGNGKALNVSGNKGLQLVNLNKSALLIGTNKPEEIKEILLNIGQYKP